MTTIEEDETNAISFFCATSVFFYPAWGVEGKQSEKVFESNLQASNNISKSFPPGLWKEYRLYINHKSKHFYHFFLLT